MPIPSDSQRIARFAAEYEFRIFQEEAEDIIKTVANKHERFNHLKNSYAFYVKKFHSPLRDGIGTVQASFGNMPLFRMSLDGKKHLTEMGASLVYSLGYTGLVLVSLYPAKSEVMEAPEKAIHLYIGKLTAHQLRKRVQGDIACLIAYGHTSAMDASPTWREKIRISILRKIKSTQSNDGFKEADLSKYAKIGIAYLPKAAITAFFGQLFKVFSIVFAVTLLLRYGFPDWAERLLPRP